MKAIFGCLGFLLGFSLQLSPIPSIIHCIQTKTLNSLTLSYFITAIIGNILWYRFGTYHQDIFITYGNIIGCCLFVTYMNIYIIMLYSNKATVSIVVNCSLLLLFSFVYNYLNKNICLYSATIINCVWQGTTIPTIKQALLNKNASYVNIHLSYVSLCNFSVWFIYGIFIHAYVMSLQNFICGWFCFMNVVIYYNCISVISDDNWGICCFRKMLITNDDDTTNNTDEHVKLTYDKYEKYI